MLAQLGLMLVQVIGAARASVSGIRFPGPRVCPHE
jgi:hypothetical protein